jgi:hypothetical protein
MSQLKFTDIMVLIRNEVGLRQREQTCIGVHNQTEELLRQQ